MLHHFPATPSILLVLVVLLKIFISPNFISPCRVHKIRAYLNPCAINEFLIILERNNRRCAAAIILIVVEMDCFAHLNRATSYMIIFGFALTIYVITTKIGTIMPA